MEDSQTVSIYENAIELTERFANCVLNNFNAQSERSTLEEVGSLILHFDNALKYNQARDKIFYDFANMIDSSSQELSCESVITDFIEKINKVKEKFRNKNSDKYVNYMKLISEQQLMKDDEITALSENINTIDPITKLPFVNPMKNKVCGHVYEKTSILELINRNPRTKCPIPGCNSADFVNKTDLIPDNSLKRILSTQCFESSQKKIKVFE